MDMQRRRSLTILDGGLLRGVGEDVEHVAGCTGGRVCSAIIDSPVPIKWPGGATMVTVKTRRANRSLAACAHMAV
jgi:hypothetical protein